MKQVDSELGAERLKKRYEVWKRLAPEKRKVFMNYVGKLDFSGILRETHGILSRKIHEAIACVSWLSSRLQRQEWVSTLSTDFAS
jgi:hypothetical protein